MPKSTSAIRKDIINHRRKSSATSGSSKPIQLTEDQIEKVRKTTREKFKAMLDEPVSDKDMGVSELSGDNGDGEKSAAADTQKIATDIEKAIFEDRENNIDQTYRSHFRQLVISLKDAKTNIKKRLLSGELSGIEFARLPFEKLLSEERRKSDEGLKQKSIEQATINSFDPHDINAFKDGREREKWGVGKSAAAIDDDDL